MSGCGESTQSCLNVESDRVRLGRTESLVAARRPGLGGRALRRVRRDALQMVVGHWARAAHDAHAETQRLRRLMRARRIRRLEQHLLRARRERLVLAAQVSRVWLWAICD